MLLRPSRQPRTVKGRGQSINPKKPVRGKKLPANINKTVIMTQGIIRFMLD